MSIEMKIRLVMAALYGAGCLAIYLLMRRIHEEMVQDALFEITMISRLSKRLLKIRKPKAAEKKPVDRAKVKASRAQRVRNRGR